MARRSGRRPGATDTREAILAAARDAFADKGYDGASIRTIATGAGVDPALVHHYFGTKDKLFLASMHVPFDPDDLVPELLAAPRDQTGDRVVHLVLRLWDSASGASALALLRSSMTNEWTARLMREFVFTRILQRVITGLDLDEEEAPLRTAFVVSQIVGLVMARYVLKLEPIASASAEQVVAVAGPTVQRYLTGELPAELAPDPAPAHGQRRRARTGRSTE
ncbi:TetR family transcriptional regulator [Planosporangium sp. 12N6]|uniref:TetR/AcrR family transcriptional regulator n=1 Tax=Planosporangium spinosum TaxID=3402278 RepID=UPI003CF6CD6D